MWWRGACLGWSVVLLHKACSDWRGGVVVQCLGAVKHAGVLSTRCATGSGTPDTKPWWQNVSNPQPAKGATMRDAWLALGVAALCAPCQTDSASTQAAQACSPTATCPPACRSASSLGEYRGIMNLCRVLPNGTDAKEVVDDAIDMAAAIGNIRGDIHR